MPSISLKLKALGCEKPGRATVEGRREILWSGVRVKQNYQAEAEQQAA